MIEPCSFERILAYGEPVDMRKSFNGLLGIVKRELKEDPLSATLFVFANRRGNYLKCVYWDRTGFCLFAKRLERGRFRFPMESLKQEFSEKIFKLILDGIIVGARRQMR